MNENDLLEEQLIDLSMQAAADKRAIVIFQDTDGNYRGYAHKQNEDKTARFIQARAGDPNTVVTMLITHP